MINIKPGFKAKILSLNILKRKKKSKDSYTRYLVQPKTSQRKIGNNIQEKLYRAKLKAYTDKEKSLVRGFKKLKKIYQKSIKLSKNNTIAKNKYPEDIEQVVILLSIIK